MQCNSATHTAHVNDLHLRFAKYVSHITAQEIWYTRKAYLDWLRPCHWKTYFVPHSHT